MYNPATKDLHRLRFPLAEHMLEQASFNQFAFAFKDNLLFLVSDSNQIVTYDIEDLDCKASVFIKEETNFAIFIKDDHLYSLTESGMLVKYDLKSKEKKGQAAFMSKPKGEWSASVLPRKSNALVCYSNCYHKLEETELTFTLFNYKTMQASKSVKSGLPLIRECGDWTFPAVLQMIEVRKNSNTYIIYVSTHNSFGVLLVHGFGLQKAGYSKEMGLEECQGAFVDKEAKNLFLLASGKPEIRKIKLW